MRGLEQGWRGWGLQGGPARPLCGSRALGNTASSGSWTERSTTPRGLKAVPTARLPSHRMPGSARLYFRSSRRL